MPLDRASQPDAPSSPLPRAADGPVRVLIYSSSSTAAGELHAAVLRWGFDAYVAESSDTALQELSRDGIDVCLVDSSAGAESARIAERMRESQSTAQVVCLVDDAQERADLVRPDSALAVLPKPADGWLLQAAILAAVHRGRLLAENRRLKRQLSNRTLLEIVGNSPAIQLLRERVQAASAETCPVLICGEPGTGTNVAAHGIHAASRRGFRPFVRLDCRLLSAECLEHKLFVPQEERAAAHPQIDDGVADGGTVFLDNIEALAQPLQKKLSKALRLRREERGGGGPAAVRILAATHADPGDRIARKQFRQDLFDELSARLISTPTLRERKSDICLLTEHFLNRLVAREGRPARRVTLDAMRLLESYHWPGNVRELQNVIERACSLDFGERLTADMVRPWLAGGPGESVELVGMTLKEMERKLIETTFARCDGNRERTAQALQIGLRTLSGKLREYGYPPRGGPGSNIAASRDAA